MTVRVIDRERTQKEGGRLDLLFESDDDVRYEVEIQLGKTDPSHIIRTIEYWDNEKRLFPSYDHVADAILALINGNKNTNIKLSYVLGYIGFKVNNKTVNFASVEPRKRCTLIKIFAQHEAISDLTAKLSLTDIKYKDNCLMIRVNIEYPRSNSRIVREMLLEAINARCQDVFE